MKNVLLLIKGLGRGGAEQILVSSARYRDTTRFRYEVAYLLPNKTALVGDLEAADVLATCLDGSRGAGWIRRLRTLVLRHDIDLIHVHSPYPAVGARLGLGRARPIVYTEHNVWERYHPATRWGNLLTFGLNAHVFAVSQHVRSSISYPPALSFLPMPNVETLYHGPDPAMLAAAEATDGNVRDELGIAAGAPVVGTVANLKPHKGHSQLLRAAVRVRRLIPEVRFVLVGQGPLEPELRRQARAFGLQDAVIFAGYRADALSVAREFDIFVLPSVHEGLAIALIESMALGKPVVVTRVGGLPEVVEDGKNGFVVPPAMPHLLANAMVKLLLDHELRSSFGAAARDRAKSFRVVDAVRRIETVYEELT